jgi:hypothetical protein
MESDGRAKPGFRFYGPDIRPLWDKSADDAQLSLDGGSDSDVSDEEQAKVEAPITVSSDSRIAGRLKLVDLQAEVEARELLIHPPVLAGLVAALNSGKHVVLTGAPGTAKTTLAEAVSAVAHRAGLCTGHTLATATADWSTYETVGITWIERTYHRQRRQRRLGRLTPVEYETLGLSPLPRPDHPTRRVN